MTSLKPSLPEVLYKAMADAKFKPVPSDNGYVTFKSYEEKVVFGNRSLCIFNTYPSDDDRSEEEKKEYSFFVRNGWEYMSDEEIMSVLYATRLIKEKPKSHVNTI